MRIWESLNVKMTKKGKQKKTENGGNEAYLAMMVLQLSHATISRRRDRKTNPAKGKQTKSHLSDTCTKALKPH